MIQKVNRPPYLELVGKSKEAKNDPGGSQGGGNCYEKLPNQGGHSEPQTDPEKTGVEQKSTPPGLSLVVQIEQSGMTEVIKDLMEQKAHEPPAPNRPGLATRYSADSSTAKGLLLNRKAE